MKIPKTLEVSPLLKGVVAALLAALITVACATSGPNAAGNPPTASAEAAQVAYRYATVDGLKVFYREAGSRANPTIVLLHGFPTSSHMYRSLIPLLADRFHVVAPDYIGYGHSDAPPVSKFEYTFDNLASVANSLLEQIGASNYILYMQDFGGPVGFRIATAHPERVRGLVVQNANAYNEGLSDAAKGFLFPLWKERNEKTLAAVRNLLTIDGTKFQYLTGTRQPANRSPDTWTLDQARLDRPGSAERQLALFIDYEKNVALYDKWHAYLRKHQPKTLIVWGKGDPFFTVPGAEAYRKDLPQAELHVLNTGHFALEEDAERVAELIRQKFI